MLMDILESVVSKFDAQEYGGGAYYMALCPFHDDHRPSLRISAKGYRCYSCGARGPLSKLAPVTKSDIQPAMAQNGNRGPFPPYSDWDALYIRLDAASRWLQQSESAMFYLKKRCLDDIAFRYFLGYWKGWYTVPAFAEDGRLIGAVGRASPSIDKKRIKPYVVPDGQPNMLYVPDRTLYNKSNFVCVVFGILDALTLAKLGFPGCSPTLGQFSCDPGWFAGIKKPILIIPDKDEGLAASKLADKLGWRGKVIKLSYPCGKDVNDYLMAGKEATLVDEIMSIFSRRKV